MEVIPLTASSSCSTDPKVLSSLCIIYIKSIGVVKSNLKIVFILHNLLKTINITFLTLQIQKGLDGISMLSISLENINLKKYLGPDYMEFFQHWGCTQPC